MNVNFKTPKIIAASKIVNGPFLLPETSFIPSENSLAVTNTNQEMSDSIISLELEIHNFNQQKAHLAQAISTLTLAAAAIEQKQQLFMLPATTVLTQNLADSEEQKSFALKQHLYCLQSEENDLNTEIQNVQHAIKAIIAKQHTCHELLAKHTETLQAELLQSEQCFKRALRNTRATQQSIRRFTNRNRS